MAIPIHTVESLPQYAADLLHAASSVAGNSYNPYSRYVVGAAVETLAGTIYKGAFMENVSYGMTICAEPAAILSANTAGERDIIRAAVVGGPADEASSSDPACMPCGRCRQIFGELQILNDREIEIYCSNTMLTNIVLVTSGELLPHAFRWH